MGNHTNIEKMSREALLADLTPEQREFLDKVRAGKKDPVFFAENLLGVKLHDGQKLWLWMTTRTQSEQAYDLGALLGTWKSRGEFDELLARNPDFSKNILVPSNRWGKTLVTSVKHVWYNYYKVGVRAKGKEWAAIRCGTLNLSPHSNQAQAGFDYIVDILASKLISTIAGNTINNKCIIPDFYVSDSVQKRQIFFKNGTSYKAVPTGEDQASSLAGTPYLYISYDECAQCYSDDTEVLTDLGWKKFYNVAIGELVPSINIETGLVEKVKVKSVINEPYEGDMIQFGGEKQQFTDLLVTPNHKMLVAKSKGANQYGSFAFEEAGNLIGKQFKLNQSFTATGRESAYFMIPAYRNKMSGSGLYVRGERKVVVEDFLLFLGLYISEGSVWKGRITISQTEKGKAFYVIPKLLDSMGFSWSLNNKVGYHVFDKQLAEFIKYFVPCLAENKRIPRETLNLSPRLLRLLFDGLILGDGSYKKSGKGCGIYGTTSKGLADDVMELCLRIGLVPSLKADRGGSGGFIKGRKIKGSLDFYRIQFRKRGQFPRINHHPKNTAHASVKKVFYSGNIACLALEKNHTLMVRRNGRVAWSGNSLHLKQELPAKIMSRLIDFGGPLDLVSTPEVDKPSHQYFFHISKLGLKGEEGWWTLLGKISDNIFLGPVERDRIAAQIRSTDPAKYRQVMFGEFVTTGKKMFDSILIERIWDADVPEMPKYEHKYLVIGDWGFADTGDPTVFYVLDYTECLNEKVPKHLRKVRISFREEIRGGSPFAVLARARMLQREWNGAKFLHDSGAMGGVIIKKMLVEMGMTDVLDFNAGGDKADMLFCLLMAMTRNRKTELDPENKVIELNPEFGAIRGYHITQLEEQMGNYQYNPEKGITDKKLEQDDVMCLGMGIWYLERKMFKNTVTRFDFNPFANRVEDIFAQKSGQKVPVRIIDIPEKRIW